ncbi:MAG: hypothetical protein HY059_05045 [Proteobacteria bacterium]|nr:hypothetical protein [Pseudomonadota bacterium]
MNVLDAKVRELLRVRGPARRLVQDVEQEIGENEVAILLGDERERAVRDVPAPVSLDRVGDPRRRFAAVARPGADPGGAVRPFRLQHDQLEGGVEAARDLLVELAVLLEDLSLVVEVPVERRPALRVLRLRVESGQPAEARLPQPLERLGIELPHVIARPHRRRLGDGEVAEEGGGQPIVVERPQVYVRAAAVELSFLVALDRDDALPPAGKVSEQVLQMEGVDAAVRVRRRGSGPRVVEDLHAPFRGLRRGRSRCQRARR